MTSEWKGSIGTARDVAGQIAERFGAEAAKEYNPTLNCFTYSGWKERGFQVRKGEKSLHSLTFVKMEQEESLDGKKKMKVVSIPKSVYLFWKGQVEPSRFVSTRKDPIVSVVEREAKSLPMEVPKV